MSWLDILVVVAAGVLATFAAVRLMQDNGWDIAAPLIASGVAAVWWASRGIEMRDGEDTTNGIALFLWLAITVSYWMILAVTVFLSHGWLRARAATRPDAD